MAKYDANFGARKTERRRFRLFLFIMLPLLAGLGYLLSVNPPNRAKPQAHEQRASFMDAVREIWDAIRMTYSLEIDEDGRPVPPPFTE